MKRLVVFGEIYSPNVGDGVIFECIKFALNRHRFEAVPCDISLRTGYQHENQQIRDDQAGKFRRFVRYFVRRSLMMRRAITAGRWFLGGHRKFVKYFEKDIEESDGVIIGGGQILVDRQLGFPLRMAAICSLAKKHGKQIAIFSCGGDQRQGLIARTIYRRVAEAAAYINVRDTNSRDFLLSLDLNLAVDVQPDVGFLMSRAFPLEEVKSPEMVVGINIMSYETLVGFAPRGLIASKLEYREEWTALIQKILDAGWQVHLMTNGDPLDAMAAYELSEAFSGDDRVALVLPPNKPEDITLHIQSISLLIATRMHSGIVAYSYGRPVIPIVWDEKVSCVWREATDTTEPINYFSNGLSQIDAIFLKNIVAKQNPKSVILIQDRIMSGVARLVEKLK